jgi:putative ABC transport system permease protein
VDQAKLCRDIERQTGLKAVQWRDFANMTVGYFLKRTGIPVNFGITVMLGFVVGAAIAGQTFYLFVIENMRQFGALKAIGVGAGRITRMVLLQAGVVGSIGFGIGMGMAGAFFFLLRNETALRGFFMPWQIMLITAGAVSLIIALAAIVSIRKVLSIDPALVFRA